ncbi:MAG: hypothetical protein ACKVI3_04485 [Verrucomicrobiia bacterium]
MNRRSWFKRAGASLIGLAIGSRLTADAPVATPPKASTSKVHGTRRKPIPQPGINHGFDEGFF